MLCGCEHSIPASLKIEGDVGADPLWCANCGYNIDIADLPLSNNLVAALSSWNMTYGEWIDWNTDKLKEDGIQLEKQFNRAGEALTEKVRREIGHIYGITFVPSTSARLYSETS
ncbi:hypothetical protein J27TS8_38280 [Robertmurraya siralis]|uniref:Uncharacterized protein n=1 Tax=Robertmurraya siralis TaxID=77777 RepID=A0A919WKU3_9BACI|nr:hypothetical protein [Robertmurraya siralis]GIN63835.1 hypothetical protein J27TS8_38280 [Robertmurraya siralis]